MFPTSSGKWSIQVVAQQAGFNARQPHVGFVHYKAASELVFIYILQISPSVSFH
jgi:hypothetical protein